MKYYLKSLMLVLVLAVLLFCLPGCSDSGKNENTPEKAAIIDQLYLLEPNPSFIDNTTQILEAYGFTVDLWQGADVTVDFYRELPAMDYKLIVFRVHSGLLMSLEGGEASKGKGQNQ